jgi:hypothetical protein
MRKAQLITREEKEESRILADIKRTPEERIRLMFELSKLAIKFGPPEGFKHDVDRGLVCYTLKRKDQNA